MEKVTIYTPKKLVFGEGCFDNIPQEVKELSVNRIFVLTFQEIRETIDPVLQKIREGGVKIKEDLSIRQEPTVGDFNRVLENAREFQPDLIIGIGGGSVLDVAKLIAVFVDGKQQVKDSFGINLLTSRNTKLICIPTTSGTGSEMSPNAILLDEVENLKKGIISPFLVPDFTCIDPKLTVSVPAKITAATGVDAFTHCLEAYVNNFAHPLVDTFAIDGMRLIYQNLISAVRDGENVQARSAIALGSMYGGMCLGPVNTTAIHALSYPLGSEFHIAHGLSNALLLPAVVEYNNEVSFKRYAAIARVLGFVEQDDKKASLQLIEMLKNWLSDLGIPAGLSAINIPEEAIPGMAKAAITVQRLLKNNPREIGLEDAINIYQKAF